MKPESHPRPEVRAAKSAPPGPIARTFVSAAILTLAFAHIRYLWFVCDDAFITFRYARNLASGLGPVWNPGERVEGYTNFLWMLASAAVLKLGGRPDLAMPVASAACALIALAVILWHFRSRGSMGTYAALLLATSSGFAAWATGGLETAAFTLWVTLGFLAVSSVFAPDAGAQPVVATGAAGRKSVQSPPLQPGRPAVAVCGAIAFGLAALTRPEGVLLGVCALAFLVWQGSPGKRDLKPAAVFAVAWTAPVAAHVIWRLAYYGRLLPNTAAVKAPGFAAVEAGARYLGDALQAQHLYLWVLPLVLVPLAGLAAGIKDPRNSRRLSAELRLAAVLALPYLACVVATGGDFMPLHRFLAPILPLGAIAVAALLDDQLGGAARPPGPCCVWPWPQRSCSRSPGSTCAPRGTSSSRGRAGGLNRSASPAKTPSTGGASASASGRSPRPPTPWP